VGAEQKIMLFPDMPKPYRRFCQFIFLIIFFGAAVTARELSSGPFLPHLPLLVAGFSMGCAILSLETKKYASLIGALLIGFTVLIGLILMWYGIERLP
jgi:hypothetical protein